MLRDGGLAQQAIDDIPKGGKARVDELDSFVARRSDTCVNLILVLDEERFEIQLVDMGRALAREGEFSAGTNHMQLELARASNCGRERKRRNKVLASQ